MPNGHLAAQGVGVGGRVLQTPGVTESVCIARRLSPRLGSGCTEPERCGNQRGDLHSRPKDKVSRRGKMDRHVRPPGRPSSCR